MRLRLLLDISWQRNQLNAANIFFQMLGIREDG